MIDPSLQDILIAFGATAAAGLATVAGSLLVFTAPPNPRLLAFGLAFAGGAMVYVSLAEILQKSIIAFDTAWGEPWGFTGGTLAFLGGLCLIALIDLLIPNPHTKLSVDEMEASQKSQDYIKRVGLMAALAITAHNFPEGLATFFAMLDSPELGLPLAVAIALHNIPEGISIAVPVYVATNNKGLAIGASFLSGLAEPVGAAIGYGLLAPFLSDAVFGAVFGIIAGVMVFLALDELLPAAKRYAQGHETVYGLISGMAILAVSLILFRI
ncbi:MAG: zinc transporter ZupT [Alphaproteobacteria bacterium]|nr:zinc transporter ZupT [Alphaproteobacteria bacterium]MCD8526587.1 zinc transporter ZupT [Alphaproteobacteria bacterium]